MQLAATSHFHWRRYWLRFSKRVSLTWSAVYRSELYDVLFWNSHPNGCIEGAGAKDPIYSGLGCLGDLGLRSSKCSGKAMRWGWFVAVQFARVDRHTGTKARSMSTQGSQSSSFKESQTLSVVRLYQACVDACLSAPNRVLRLIVLDAWLGEAQLNLWIHMPGQNKAVSQVRELRKIPLASQNHDSIDSSCQGTTSQQDSQIHGKWLNIFSGPLPLINSKGVCCARRTASHNRTFWAELGW